jgi:hypothetical protein
MIKKGFADLEHDCLESLVYREVYCAENMNYEVDGAIARSSEEWWECSKCGETFTGKDLSGLKRRLNIVQAS